MEQVFTIKGGSIKGAEDIVHAARDIEIDMDERTAMATPFPLDLCRMEQAGNPQSLQDA